MSESAYKAITNISILSILVPILCAVFRFKNMGRTLFVLFIVLILGAFTEILSRFFSNLNLEGYNVTQNGYTWAETILFLLMYRSVFQNTKIKATVLLIVILAVLYLLFTIVTTNFQKLNFILNPLECVLMISLSLYYFYSLFAVPQSELLQNNPMFWINTAILYYFSTSLFIFLFKGYLSHCEINTFRRVLSLHLFANIIQNLLFAVAIWKTKPTLEAL